MKIEATWVLNETIKMDANVQYIKVYAEIILNHLFARTISFFPIALPINEHDVTLSPNGTMNKKAVMFTIITKAAYWLTPAYPAINTNNSKAHQSEQTISRAGIARSIKLFQS